VISPSVTDIGSHGSAVDPMREFGLNTLSETFLDPTLRTNRWNIDLGKIVNLWEPCAVTDPFLLAIATRKSNAPLNPYIMPIP
jgi:hypothetical protein